MKLISLALVERRSTQTLNIHKARCRVDDRWLDLLGRRGGLDELCDGGVKRAREDLLSHLNDWLKSAAIQFRKDMKDKMKQLRMDTEFARRYVNDGFSGGEMKRAEILQMAMLRPKFAILDETDSGLDVDAVKLASQSISEIGGDQ